MLLYRYGSRCRYGRIRYGGTGYCQNILCYGLIRCHTQFTVTADGALTCAAILITYGPGHALSNATIVLLLFFTLMGGAYLPWFISSISTAILADIILSVFGYDRAIPQVVSWALMQLGSAAGQWIPIWFFTDRFRQDWIDRGQSAATMDAMIHYAVGIWGIISVLVVASLSMIGVLIGRKVLKKYKK